MVGPARVEPFARRANGRPSIPCDPASLYKFASLVRVCEETILDFFKNNECSGTTHTCLGQELCQIAVVRALADDGDCVFSTHRNHGHYLAFTGDFVGLTAEILGRQSGICGGRGGSQHLATQGFLSTGVQAGLCGVAVGNAYERKSRGLSGISVVMLGDGTFGEGLLYESLNLAAVWRVRVLFVVENNGIAQSTSTKETLGSNAIAERGRAFGLRVWKFDDSDRDFADRVGDAIDEVRIVDGPGMFVIETRRQGPHSKGDDVRAPEEIAAAIRRDPLMRLGERLEPLKRTRIDEENAEFMRVVAGRALSSPESRWDPPSAGDASRRRRINPRAGSVYSGSTVRQSLNAALADLLRTDEKVRVVGQDVSDPYGGAFKVTAGLSSEFPDRVLSTPVSEAAVVGAGIGMALSGLKPVVEIMFSDFLTLAVDQLLNHGLKLSAEVGSLPLVIRTPSGGGSGYGPTHSQCLETLMASLPGLAVVVPSHRHSPGDLLRRAVTEWCRLSVFVEHKRIYPKSCAQGDYVEAAADEEELGAAVFPTLVAGAACPDVTLVTYGGMLPTVEEVARRMEAEELAVRIIVPSLIAPLPARSLASLLVRSDNPVTVMVEEAPIRHGVGAELGAMLCESGYSGRFLRIGAPSVPVPAARSLEAGMLPSVDSIVSKISDVLIEACCVRQVQ